MHELSLSSFEGSHGTHKEEAGLLNYENQNRELPLNLHSVWQGTRRDRPQLHCVEDEDMGKAQVIASTRQ
jgi:hypothetical protein